MDQLRYPIGKFMFEGMTPQQRERWIEELEQLPAQLKLAIKGLDDEQLDSPYRTGGWTIRQVVHHVADASMNSFSRFKLALTESNPTIKPFKEDGWANTADVLEAPTDTSIAIVEGIYSRMSLLLRSMEGQDYLKQFYHPEKGSQVGLAYFLGFVVWHGKHHIAHITNLRERMGW